MSTTPRHHLIARAVRAAIQAQAGRLVWLGAAAIPWAAITAELPVPCTSGVCVTSSGVAVPGWVSSGTAGGTAVGNVFDIKQLSDSAVYNWKTFNVSPESIVRFTQPGADSVALNRIFQGQSTISGTLTANGRVYLLNQNGIVFGQGARVNVAGLIASSLDTSALALEGGIAATVADGQAAFQLFKDGNGLDMPSGAVRVQRDAQIVTSTGGQVLMFAPEVVNQGRIVTPDGQAMLAAGNQVFLATSSDSNLRGLLVEVGTGGGTVTNGDLAQQVGEIVADRGNITLAGLAVNQLGRVNATTTVRQNGTIRLQARDGGSANSVTDLLQAGLNNGELTLGKGSITEVNLAGSDKAVDATEQLRSRIDLQGRSVSILDNAKVLAKGGQVNVAAISNGLSHEGFSSTTGSRIYLARNATIDVSGASTELPVERNVVTAELRGNELADSPQQRTGPLRGKAVRIDIRQSGTRDDSTVWQGTPLGDVSGQISLIERGVNERNLGGGTVNLSSQFGDVIVADGASIDLSGGQIRYTDGYINTTKLLGANGSVYDISQADPDRQYTGIAPGVVSLTDRRWGITENYVVAGSQGQFEKGYLEGKDAGAVRIVAPQVVFDGDIVASTVVGPYQRTAARDLAATQTFRPFDQLPLAGQLVLGLRPSGGDIDRIAGDVRFSNSAASLLPGSTVAPFNPLQDALPAGLPIQLRTDLFGDQRIARVEINSNDRVELPADVKLTLPGQGELLVTARHVDIAGDVAATSGEINLQAVDTPTSAGLQSGVDLRSGATLDVQGGWVNDSPLLNAAGAQLAPRLIDGGTITLGARNSKLDLAAGSTIDVSGGGWARANGRISAGRAGAIALESRRDSLSLPAVDFHLDAALRAFGIDTGGKLSIDAPEICLSVALCGSTQPGSLRLDPAALIAAGFADISLASNERGLRVTSGTHFDLRQVNRLLDEARALGAATGTRIAALGGNTLLPDYLRDPMRLTLKASIANAPAAYTAAEFAALSGLKLEQGASIDGSPGARVALSSNTNLVVAGSVSAPGGTIDLAINPGLITTGEFASQGIWLDSTASLLARGVAMLSPDARGLRIGDVLDGGRVRISAGRGSVLTNAGSVVDVSGTSAVLDLRDPDGSPLDTLPAVVASNGGQIDLAADNSMILGGKLLAQAGADSSTARGGALNVTLGSSVLAGRPPEANEERTIAVAKSQPTISVAPGSPVPSFLAHRATVTADSIAAGGFSEVLLRANTTRVQDLAGGGQAKISPGRIEFVGNLDLDIAGRLQLDAATLLGNGGVRVRAPYLRIGHEDIDLQGTSAFTSGGAGVLRLQGGFVDVVGNSSIDGFDAVSLQSDSDLRLNGIQQTDATRVVGSLTTDANLTLVADQVYASTLSDFAVAVQGNPSRVLRVEGTGGERADVLSAGSRLQLSAPLIEQAGVLRAPFGTVDLVADTLRLVPGSLTSTSAEGKIVPFGTLQAGTDWVYGLRNVSLVLGDTLDVPQKSVALTAGAIDIAAGAVIDISGGGDLLGYEFVPGPTGTVDVLSALQRPGRYAIVPGLKLGTAPIDPQESAGSPLRPSDSIHLSAGVAGLPAGDYVLLPARYALLPGAYVVEARSGYTDLPAGEVIRQLDGSIVVAGFRRTEGTPFAAARSSGFEIRTAAQVATEAAYTTTLASKFFKTQAEQAGTAPPRLPQDAGVLALNAVSSLNIDGMLRANPIVGARGAAVDVSAERLRVADTIAAAPGEVVVSASDLEALGAESILLGARRKTGSAGTTLDVGAQSVAVETKLSAAEILIAATGDVRLAESARLEAKGSLPVTDRYLIAGDGAYLRVASGEQAQVLRTGETGATGSLILEQGSRINAAGGALAFDASRETSSAAAFNLAGGALSVGAAKINLGAVPASASGLSLTSADLTAAGASELALISRSSIDFFGDFSLQVDDLRLDAAALRGGAATSASIDAAGTLTLVNSSGTAGVAAPGGTGTLQLTGDRLVVGPGAQAISGFGAVRAAADSGIQLQGQSGLSVNSDLTLVTPLLSAATGARGTIQTTSALLLEHGAGGAGSITADTALGGKIGLIGASINVATGIRAAAGQIDLQATNGNITLAPSAALDVSGRTRDFDGTVVAAPAGRIALAAGNGDVVAQAGSRMNLAGVADGAAGELRITAPTGTVSLGGTIDGTAAQAKNSGRVSVDAQSLGSIASMNQGLGQGFLLSREFRQRGPGDLVVDNSAGIVRARDVSLVADGGSVVVSGTIDATDVAGGHVRIAARDNVLVSGTIRAGGASGAASDKGELELLADDGAIRVGGSANLDLAGGELQLRLQRNALLTLLDADKGNDALVLSPGNSDIGRTTIEAYRRYTAGDGILAAGVIAVANTAASASNPLYADASNFMASAGSIAAALGRNADPSLRILPGIELQVNSNLSLGAANGNTVWDLSQWRFGASNLPGVLTLRAAGNLAINGSLNDGFGATGLTGTNQAQNQAAFRLAGTSDSWSYRLVAGADLGSANLRAVNTLGTGNFSIASGAASTGDVNPARFRLVRTGTGSIEVATGGDFVLGNQQSVLYTAGVAASGGVSIGIGATGLGARAYPTNGGDIDIHANGSIVGAPSNQLVTDWLWRVGKDPSAIPSGFATGWTVNFGRFQQNIAALGGGDVRISAGGDIRDLSASIPTIGMQTGGGTAALSAVQIIGGGDLDVRAGGDILGGSYYVGRGTGSLQAAGEVGKSLVANRGLYPVLALGEGSWSVGASGSTGIEAVVNPTLLPQGKSQNTVNTTQSTSYFSTYATDAKVNLFSAAGDVFLSNNHTLLSAALTSADWSGFSGIGGAASLALYAPSLSVASLAGDVVLSGTTTLYPAPGATLALYADRNITRGNSRSGDVLTQSDADPALLPSIAAPDSTALDLLQVATLAGLHAGKPVHAGDNSVTRIVARTGDISFKQIDDSPGATISLATPLRMVAGGDIIDLPLVIQHDDAADLSSISAGGDIRFTVSRAASGSILPNPQSIDVDGPGTLQLAAGGSIDLQNSAGITSRGNLVNPNLPDGGAAISILVGARESAADHAAMIAGYLGESSLYDEALFAEVAKYRGAVPVGKSQALQAFRALSREQQRGLLEQVLLAELRASAKFAASADLEKNGDYSRGFSALERMFPGANPDTKAGQVNAYSGDLNLYFSRVYTQSGGNIRLLAPGGEVNAGLATPPAAFGINKSADLLGVVARNVGNIDILTYNDLQVNESRVFAVNDSDIMVWSTNGDIDAGRGAKTAISAPAPVINYDRDGRANVTYAAALAGSGIQTRTSTPDQQRGDVVLAAPRGIVNAGDAGIVAGNLTIAATAVVGADNISLSGVAVGVPVDTGGLGVSLAGVSAAASSASSAASEVNSADSEAQSAAPMAETAMTWLDVFVTGLGEENCRPDDEECLKKAQQ